MNKAVKQYLKAIERALCCDRRTKKGVLSTLQNRIAETDILEEAYDFEALCARFGAPDALANSFMGTIDPQTLRKSASRKRIILLILIGAVLAALLAWGIVMLLLFHEGQKNVNGFTVDLLDKTEYVLSEDKES